MVTETALPTSAGGDDELGGRSVSEHTDALLSTIETAALLSLSPRTLETLRVRGGGIPFIALSRRCVRYKKSDVLAYIESRRRKSTSDPGAGDDAPAAAG